MDIGTISLILMVALIALLAIGMPLGFASAVLAVLVLVLRFEPDLIFAPWTFGDGMLTAKPGSGALNLLQNKIYGLLTDYVLISIPLFIFMAALLERSGIAKTCITPEHWLNRRRGGHCGCDLDHGGDHGGDVRHHRRRSRFAGLIALPQMLRLGYNQNLAIGTICASGSLAQ